MGAGDKITSIKGLKRKIGKYRKTDNSRDEDVLLDMIEADIGEFEASVRERLEEFEKKHREWPFYGHKIETFRRILGEGES